VTVDGKRVWSKLETKRYRDVKMATDAVTAALA
jgi:hypothetical protein